MNTFWIKIASGAIGILIIIVLVSMFMPSGNNEPASPLSPEPNLPTTFYGQAKQDQNELLTMPQEVVPESNQTPENVVEPPAPVAVQPVPVEPPQTNEITIYAKKLSENEEILAQEQLDSAAPMFSIGRLPGPSFGPAIEAARRILNRWPESIYAYQAKKLLAKVPERYHAQYHITAEELDTSMFLKSRTGTLPYKVKAEE